jgi:hypothetical protein
MDRLRRNTINRSPNKKAKSKTDFPCNQAMKIHTACKNYKPTAQRVKLAILVYARKAYMGNGV